MYAVPTGDRRRGCDTVSYDDDILHIMADGGQWTSKAVAKILRPDLDGEKYQQFRNHIRKAMGSLEKWHYIEKIGREYKGGHPTDIFRMVIE